MNGIDYLADTNCFIYYLDAHPFFSAFRQNTWTFSYITEIELLSKSSLTSEDEVIIKDLLSIHIKLDHSQLISDLAVNIRKKYKLKLPDAIIAATAQAHGIPFLTTDKDFARIENFDCIILDI